MIAPTSTIDSILQTGGTTQTTSTNIYTDYNNTSLPKTGGSYGTLPPRGTSVIPPEPVDSNVTATLPTKGTSVIAPEPVDTTVTGVSPTGSGVSTISPNPLENITVEETLSSPSVAETKTETKAETKAGTTETKAGTILNPIKSILGNINGGGAGGSEKETTIKLNKNPNYWIYIIIGGTVLYLLAKKKKK